MSNPIDDLREVLRHPGELAFCLTTLAAFLAVPWIAALATAAVRGLL